MTLYGPRNKIYYVGDVCVHLYDDSAHILGTDLAVHGVEDIQIRLRLLGDLVIDPGQTRVLDYLLDLATPFQWRSLRFEPIELGRFQSVTESEFQVFLDVTPNDLGGWRIRGWGGFNHGYYAPRGMTKTEALDSWREMTIGQIQTDLKEDV